MICPNCGLKQRETSECLQCQMPLQGAKKKDEKQIPEKQSAALQPASVLTETRSDPPPKRIEAEKEISRPKIEKGERGAGHVRSKAAKEISQRQAGKLAASRPEPPPFSESPAVIEEETMVQEEPSPPTEKPGRKPPKEAIKEPRQTLHSETNTGPQEAEKKILVTTTQKIEGKRIKGYYGLVTASIMVELDNPLLSGSDRKMTSMTGSQNLKMGVLRALKDLRSEAAQYGANAVVATSLNLQKIDSQSFLLSAVGTAVLAEEPK